MRVTPGNRIVAAPRSASRVLCGLSDVGPSDPGLRAHLDRWGPTPRSGRLIDELDASGLVGRGGAGFPVATKWRAVAGASRRRPAVVANGAEGEPASRKDAFLMSHAPHLVLDGLALAADALGARQAIVYAPPSSIPIMETALAERRSRRVDPIVMELAESPEMFIAGQESALVSQLGGRRGAVPSFIGVSPIRERGLGGRPTLVQNVETLAHVALVARFGAKWFRSIGTNENPGTMLLTVSGSAGPLVVEAALGSSLLAATGLTAGDVRRSSGFLLGGYGGAWVTSGVFQDLSLSEATVQKRGATLGAGVVVRLPDDVCPLAEMADVVRYMDEQGAGQCGPCLHGLSELASSLDRLAYGGPGGPRLQRFLEICHLVEGRGACRHPDGVARFVRTGLAVFSEEVAGHQRHGACSRTHAAASAPRHSGGYEALGKPVMSRGKLRLVLDPTACDGHGVCAELLPEHINLDRWGYPVIDDTEVSTMLRAHVVRAVRSCPKQALHILEEPC